MNADPESRLADAELLHEVIHGTCPVCFAPSVDQGECDEQEIREKIAAEIEAAIRPKIGEHDGLFSQGMREAADIVRRSHPGRTGGPVSKPPQQPTEMWLNALTLIRPTGEQLRGLGREVVDLVMQSMSRHRDDPFEPIGLVFLRITAS